MVRVDEPYVFVVDKADGLVHSYTSWQLREAGLEVDGNPCMLPGGIVAYATDLLAVGDDIDYPLWSRLSGLVRLVIVSNGVGVLPLVGEEFLEVTSLKELGYL